MRTVFNPSFVGLQIDWEVDKEIEYLGPAVLAGAASVTAATCLSGKRPISYTYPIDVVEKTSNRLILGYSRKPRGWPKSWEIEKGHLVIDLDRAGCPIRLEYHHASINQSELLARGKDWEYIATAAPGPKIIPRGRLQTSRLERPLQQWLRNLLLSQHGQCQVTGTTCVSVLEACHIVPVKNGGEDLLGNALLLRTDLHRLFDAGLMRFRPSNHGWQIELDSSVNDLVYRQLNGRELITSIDLSNPFLEARMLLEAGHGG